MSAATILVEHLGKRYRVGHQRREPYTALRDVLAAQARSAAQRLLHPFQRRPVEPRPDDFWALNDVGFEIQKGEVVGVIGRNGAGKSTLLKILSRITEPTTGRITIDGRVGSLLEVGTGFHPELTGRENIYLNGAILGMSRGEIQSRFDAIVSFAEVEQFLDTPVKRFSTGMYLRLAFAVAAHLNPEILLVDEVLAVGDAGFQKKCIGKMDEVSKEGRTVLFVSHNMAAVSKLCSRALVLDRGRLAFVGDKKEAINHYLKSVFGNLASMPIAERRDRNGNGQLRITEFGFYNSATDRFVNHASCDDPLEFRIRYRSRLPSFKGRFSMAIYDVMDVCPIFLDTMVDPHVDEIFPQEGELRVVFSRDFALAPGDYTLNVAGVVNSDMADHVINAAVLHIDQGNFFGTGRSPGGKSLCFAKHQWSVHKR